MRFLALLLPLLLLQDDDKDYTNLFNGRDFEGFRFILRGKEPDPDKTFSVKDKTIICTGSPPGFMVTQKSYKNFTLRFDFRYKRPEKLEDESKFYGNSGYLLFVKEDKIWPKSLEIQGMNRDAGAIIPIKCKAKWKTDKDAIKKAIKKVGEWNSMEITSKNGKIVVKLNGTTVSTVSECELKEGPIGFQSEGAEIHWRKIRIKEEK